MEIERFKIKTNHIHNNGGMLYLIDGYLYKYYDSAPYFLTEKERNITFLMSEDTPNTPKIIRKLYKNGHFCGYVMEYIDNAKTLREGMADNISDDDKIKIIADLFSTLKYLHSNNICLGDIHMDNFLYKEGHGFVIDLDEIRFPGDEFKFRECFLVKEHKTSSPSKIATFITDNIKLSICCLSFLYKIDLETIIINESLDEVKDELEKILSKEEYEIISSVLDLNNLCYLDEVLNKVKIR